MGTAGVDVVSRHLRRLSGGPPCPRARPLRACSLLSGALLLLPRPSLAAPASEAQMDLYTRIAAVNVCIARAAGVEFDRAVGIAGETIAQTIQEQHGGMIAQVSGSALGAEELRRGSINSAVIAAAALCPQAVPAAVMERVQAALRQAGPAGTPPGGGARP